MEYPDWAPSVLVNLHKARLEMPIHMFDPKDQVEKFKNDEKFKDMPDDFFERIERKFYRNLLYNLPEKEGTEVLYSLLTDLRMKSAWSSLSKRVVNENMYHRFWSACQSGITIWRSEQKFTPKEKMIHFNKMHDHAMGLLEMIDRSSEFEYYSVAKSMDEKQLKWLTEALEAKPLGEPFSIDQVDILFLSEISEFSEDQIEDQIDFTSFSVNKIIPPIQTILLDIASKANECASEELLVKKPNSANAKINYFIRYLSGYMKSEYGQPLHDVVSATTSIVFDKDIDSDHVRHIVKK